MEPTQATKMAPHAVKAHLSRHSFRKVRIQTAKTNSSANERRKPRKAAEGRRESWCKCVTAARVGARQGRRDGGMKAGGEGEEEDRVRRGTG